MCHRFRAMCKKTGFPLLCGILLLLAADIVATGSSLAAEDSAATGKNVISAVTGHVQGSTLTIRIKGSDTPAYTVYELFKPARIVVDVAQAELAPAAQIRIDETSGIRLNTKSITDTTPKLIRFSFVLPTSLPFTVTEEHTDIVLTIKDVGLATTDDSAGNSWLKIKEIKVASQPGETVVQLLANGPIDDFKYDVLPKKGSTPPRLYIDVNNVSGDSLPREQKVGTALERIRVAKRGSGLRVVLDSASDTLFPFTVSKTGNGLEVHIRERKENGDQLAALISEKQSIESQLPKVNPLQVSSTAGESAGQPQDAATAMQDAFSFSGYNKKRISVDFYKIDLHNVFRLLREVSGVNIVVDEDVKGALTLALDNVPWDFALDIILNLKDLRKVERFNTLVILPKNKAFDWPERAEDNLSFEPDTTVTAQEAIIIQQRESMSKELIKAKQLIAQARELEKKEEFESAIQLYQKALELWPDNARLANRIASIYLVQLHQNAKAVFYAKKALQVDPKNSAAALNAAIGLANMEEYKAAQEYFDQSVSVEKPSSEALLSYAVFSEERKKYEGALKLLKKHDALYGQNLDSMVFAARVLDKMGQHEKATEEYKAILLSGYRIPPDLTKFIQGRIALSQSM